jgi:hypothetical protein
MMRCSLQWLACWVGNKHTHAERQRGAIRQNPADYMPILFLLPAMQSGTLPPAYYPGTHDTNIAMNDCTAVSNAAGVHHVLPSTPGVDMSAPPQWGTPYGFTTSLDGTLVKKYRQRHLLRCKLWGGLLYVLMTSYAWLGRLACVVEIAGYCQKLASGAVGTLCFTELLADTLHSTKHLF